MRAFIEAFFCTLTVTSAQVMWKLASVKSSAAARDDATMIQNIMSLILSPWMLGGFLVYGIATVMWIYLLGKYELSYIYPMLSMVFIFTMIASKLVFNEHIGISKVLGVAAIIIGVVLISRSTNPGIQH